MFSTSAFQSGAIEYAGKHGIALVQIIGGHAAYVQANVLHDRPPIPEDAEDFAGFFYGPNPTGRLIYPEIITSRSNYALDNFIEAAN